MLPLWADAGGSPSLVLDLLSGALDPRLTFARASGATEFDATGTLQGVASDAPRFDYGPSGGSRPLGLLVEPQSTNAIRNPRCEGAVVGSPGTIPTDWLNIAGNTGTAIIGTGTEEGIPYIDLHVVVAAQTGWAIAFDGITSISAAPGQNWSSSAFVRLVAGSMAGVTEMNICTRWYTSGGAFISQALANFTPTSASLASQRVVGNGNIAPATTGCVISGFRFSCSAATDFTVRIGLPQLVQEACATTPILPAVGSPASATRARDVCTMPIGPWFNPAEGTLLVRTMSPYVGAPLGGNVSRIIAEICNADETSNIQIRHAVADIVPAVSHVQNSNNFYSIAGPTALVAGSPVTLATTYKIGAGGTFAQGGVLAVLGTTPPSLPFSGMTALRLGSGINPSATGALSGYIQRVKYWPRALSNAELQQVTT